MSTPAIPLLTVLEQAARMANFLKAPGRGMSGSEQQEMLYICNSVLDGLKAQRLFFPEIIATDFEVQQNQQEYGVGPADFQPTDGSGYWIIERPEKLLGAAFLIPTSPQDLVAEVPMDLVVDWVQWKNIVTKKVTSSQPRAIYYQALFNPGIGKASVWPVPQQTSTVRIYTPSYINEFSDVMDTIIFPKGWRIFLEFELAVQAHMRHPERPMDPMVPMLARQYKADVMANALTPLLISSDPAVNQRQQLPTLRWYDARSWPGGY